MVVTLYDPSKKSAFGSQAVGCLGRGGGYVSRSWGALRKAPRDLAVSMAALCHGPPWSRVWDPNEASSFPPNDQGFAQCALGAALCGVFAERGDRRRPGP